MILSVDHIIQAGGLLAIAAVIFFEGALLVGLILPGDTLLIPAGIWAAHHHNQLNIWLLVPTVMIASILGYQVGYKVGEKTGPRIFTRSGGILFRADYIPRTQAFLSRRGGASMIVGRFVAVVRTLLPIMAGIGKMPKRRFFLYNVIGAVVWTLALVLASYWIGQRVDNIDKYIVPIVAIGLVATVIGEFSFVLRNRSSRRAFVKALQEEWNYLFKQR